MEFLAEIWSRAFSLEWLAVALIISTALALITGGLRTALIMGLLAVVIDTLLPVGLSIAATGMPEDVQGEVLSLFKAMQIDVAAVRYVMYVFMIFVIAAARRDIFRHYTPSSTSHEAAGH